MSRLLMTPGKKANVRRMLHYASLRAPLNGCACQHDKVDKAHLDDTSNTVAARTSRNMRVAQQLQTVYHGGNIHFGSFYLGVPLHVDAFGRTPGMPGGSGRPPTNF